MWTLDLMRKFVLSCSVEISCPSCRGSHKHGMRIFKAALLIAPEWNDKTYTTEATVQVVAIPDRATCLCQSLTGEEIIWCQDEAGKILTKDLHEFLEKNAQPKIAAPRTEAREKQLALEWKY